MQLVSATLYILPVWSADTEHSLVPVELKAISNTSSLWSAKVCREFGFLGSHNLHVLRLDE